ncbi:MAG TPA: carboxypeptidase-like regulatory domain-containing protein, partial [Gemmatimonadaceae bacterium]|nr:carboxypeptidase-like regulatory domain-containing protein [Gemmatimonadaceae bacterium]
MLRLTLHHSPRGRDARTLRLGSLLAVLAFATTTAAGAGAQSSTGIAGRVTAASGGPLQGVTVAVVGTTSGAITRGDGTYSIALAPGSYELRARFLGYTPSVQSVTVAAGEPITVNFVLERSVVGLSEVVVTGTRRPERTVVDAPAPIDVLTSEDIKQSGRVETNQIIQMLAPSFNFPRATISDGTDHVRPSTLRGLQ